MTEHEIAAKFTHAGVLMLLAVLFAASLLSGCVKRAEAISSESEQIADVSVFTDRLTGCQYLARSDYRSGGLSPRIAADGHAHLGCKGVQP